MELQKVQRDSEFCDGKRDTTLNTNSRNWTVEGSQWRKETGIEYDLGDQILLRNLAMAKTRPDIEYDSRSWIVLRFCTGKRDSTTNIICETKLYSVLQGQKRREINIIWGAELYWSFASAKRDTVSNAICETELYRNFALAKENHPEVAYISH